MKPFGFTSAILKNTKKVFSSSQANWSALREQSLIMFDKEHIFYTVSKIEQLFLIKEGALLNESAIIIPENIGLSLFKNDEIDITYKEYELSNISKIVNSGSGYKIGDVLFLNSGTPSVNKIDNTQSLASVEVRDVTIEGKLKDIIIKDKGNYIKSPESKVIGGSGENAEFKFIFQVKENRALVERELVSVDISKPNGTILNLNYPLPNGLTDVKISCKKWIAHLNSEYLGDTKIGVNYTVLRDFTPYYNFGLLVDTSLSPYPIYNETVKKLDSILFSIEQRLNKLNV